ncbi:hypothetical protein FFLO_01052 [Filobasidium floriforme]|uniref:Uncharacterized protein n=1 Tax=Filobasidium floriforme TaxID=5210 RepID=A0A8K0JQM6_9TREE|nr:hypothetical protein FFLO_01052 [Filobasidium floriforme]
MPSPNLPSPRPTAGNNFRQLNFLNSSMQGVTATIGRLCQDLADLKPLPGIVRGLRQEISGLKERVAELESRPRTVGPSNAGSQMVGGRVVSEQDLIAVGKHVRAAASLAYGCRPGSYEALQYPKSKEDWPRLGENGEGDLAMRWDLEAPFGSVHNGEQTKKLVNVLKKGRALLTLTSDIPRDTVPDYNDNEDLYNTALQSFFKQQRNSFQRETLKNWKSAGRQLVENDVKSLQEQAQALTAAGSDATEVLARIKDRKTYLEVTDKRVADSEEDMRGNIRSKATGIAKRIQQRRPLVKDYAGSEWSCLETLYGAIPLMCVRGEDQQKTYYWPIRDTVYSQKMLTAFDTIWNYKPPAVKGYSRGAVIAEPDDTIMLEDAEPFFPGEWAYLHLAPQRWMFRKEWLDSHPQYADVIVPVDSPTDVTAVKNGTWIAQHPWRFRGSKKNTPSSAQRARSQSSSAPEGRAGRSRSASQAPSLHRVDEDDRDARLEEFANKKRKVNHTSSQMSRTPSNTNLGTGLDLPGSEDDDFEEEERDGEGDEDMEDSGMCDGRGTYQTPDTRAPDPFSSTSTFSVPATSGQYPQPRQRGRVGQGQSGSTGVQNGSQPSTSQQTGFQPYDQNSTASRVPNQNQPYDNDNNNKNNDTYFTNFDDLDAMQYLANSEAFQLQQQQPGPETFDDTQFIPDLTPELLTALGWNSLPGSNSGTSGMFGSGQ